MSADFLSQDEVDALLKGVSGEADEPEPVGEAADGPRSYDCLLYTSPSPRD